jgi:hypothetical protein
VRGEKVRKWERKGMRVVRGCRVIQCGSRIDNAYAAVPAVAFGAAGTAGDGAGARASAAELR